MEIAVFTFPKGKPICKTVLRKKDSHLQKKEVRRRRLNIKRDVLILESNITLVSDSVTFRRDYTWERAKFPKSKISGRASKAFHDRKTFTGLTHFKRSLQHCQLFYKSPLASWRIFHKVKGRERSASKTLVLVDNFYGRSEYLFRFEELFSHLKNVWC
jgi:hypothetical protein